MLSQELWLVVIECLKLQYTVFKVPGSFKVLSSYVDVDVERRAEALTSMRNLCVVNRSFSELIQPVLLDRITLPDSNCLIGKTFEERITRLRILEECLTKTETRLSWTKIVRFASTSDRPPPMNDPEMEDLVLGIIRRLQGVREFSFGGPCGKRHQREIERLSRLDSIESINLTASILSHGPVDNWFDANRRIDEQGAKVSRARFFSSGREPNRWLSSWMLIPSLRVLHVPDKEMTNALLQRVLESTNPIFTRLEEVEMDEPRPSQLQSFFSFANQCLTVKKLTFIVRTDQRDAVNHQAWSSKVAHGVFPALQKYTGHIEYAQYLIDKRPVSSLALLLRNPSPLNGMFLGQAASSQTITSLLIGPLEWQEKSLSTIYDACPLLQNLNVGYINVNNEQLVSGSLFRRAYSRSLDPPFPLSRYG